MLDRRRRASDFVGTGDRGKVVGGSFCRDSPNLSLVTSRIDVVEGYLPSLDVLGELDNLVSSSCDVSSACLAIDDD
jgi:hypothetical protein